MIVAWLIDMETYERWFEGESFEPLTIPLWLVNPVIGDYDNHQLLGLGYEVLTIFSGDFYMILDHIGDLIDLFIYRKPSEYWIYQGISMGISLTHDGWSVSGMGCVHFEWIDDHPLLVDD